MRRRSTNAPFRLRRRLQPAAVRDAGLGRRQQTLQAQSNRPRALDRSISRGAPRSTEPLRFPARARGRRWFRAPTQNRRCLQRLAAGRPAGSSWAQTFGPSDPAQTYASYTGEPTLAAGEVPQRLIRCVRIPAGAIKVSQPVVGLDHMQVTGVSAARVGGHGPNRSIAKASRTG
jgi:hypothetical protein